MTEANQWEPYDPSWLVELAKEQHPDKEWLSEALAACTKVKQDSEAYIYIVDRSEWQFETNITLNSQTEGLIVLDIIKDHRIGGIEFTFYIGPRLTCPCGFIYNYPSMVSQHWIVVRHNRYEEFKKIQQELAELDKADDKQIRRSLIKAKNALMERIYQCPECSRIMWRKPGQSTFQIFAPESAD